MTDTGLSEGLARFEAGPSVDSMVRDDHYRRFNYQICVALDMTKLGIVLDKMVAEGHLHPSEAKTFQIQASALLASMRNANNRAFGKEPQVPIR